MDECFWVIKGRSGYYAPCAYRGELFKVDIAKYAERGNYHSFRSVADLLDDIPPMIKKEEGFKLVSFKFILTEVVDDNT